jgi:sugar phosphate isomerase/epimerase
MKLATANYGFRQWSLEDYLYAVKGLGLRYAEIGYTRHGTLQELYYSVDPERAVATYQLGGQLAHGDETGIARVKRVATAAGVTMHAATANYRLWGVSHTWADWAKANILLDIEIGAELGLKVLRVCEIGVPAGVSEASVFDDVAAVGAELNELARHAEQFGVTIMAENFRASSDLILAFASHFTSPNVGIHYDPHNYCRVDEDPVQALRKIKEYVRYVHVKDYRREDGQILPSDTWWPSWAVGEGEINWKEVFEELGSFYDGVVAIEYEKTLYDVLRGFDSSITYIRRVFSELGLEETD